MTNDGEMELAKLKLKAKREKSKMETKTTTAIVPAANGANMTALQVVENADKVQKIGQLYAQSGFFGAVTPSCATASLVNAFLEGISPLEYRAKYHTFEDGTTSVKSDYIQREFHRLGGKWKFNEWTPEVCDITFTYDGAELRGRVTLKEFKENGVAVGSKGLKTNWAKFPREMLKARCMATYIRAICPEALGGMYTQEEVADFDRRPSAPVEQSKQVEAVGTASPSPIADEPEVVDYAVCPCGKSKGKRFDELPTEVLEKIVELPADKFPLVTPEHKNEVIRILGEREADKNANK